MSSYFCNYCQFNRSLSDHLAKRFGHLSRGNKAATENQFQHASQDFVSTFILIDSKLYLIYYSVIDVILVLIGLTYIAVIIYSNCYMFLETRRQKKRLGTEQLPNEEAKRMKKDSKAANTLAFVVGALTLTYLPTIITTVVTVILDKPVESRIMNVLWSWLLTFFLLGSLFNPVIYCSRHTKRLEILHFRQT